MHVLVQTSNVGLGSKIQQMLPKVANSARTELCQLFKVIKSISFWLYDQDGPILTGFGATL